MMQPTCWITIFMALQLLPLCSRAALPSITLENDKIKRTFHFQNGFYTDSYLYKVSGTNMVRQPDSEEFAFCVNGRPLSGRSDFSYLNHTLTAKKTGVQELNVTLQTKAQTNIPIRVTVKYLLYDNLAVVRKFLSIENISNKSLSITDLEMEKLNLSANDKWLFDALIYSEYGTVFNKAPYVGDYHDAAVMVYNAATWSGNNEGFIAGNEAPGVLKRTAVYQTPGVISIGMRSSDEDFSFKRNLAPGEIFDAPPTFLCMYINPSYQDAFTQDYATFIRKHLGVRLFEQENVPFTMYNTWQPFTYNINEKLIHELADALAGTGTDLFIIDDGWQNESGEWQVDRNKFPNGLKPVCDYIRSKGMQVGLWFAFGNVKASSRLAKEHPEWLIHDINGKPMNIHFDNPQDLTMSMGSGWFDYMLNVVRRYVRELDIHYLKLDLTTVTSAYMLDYKRSGDYRFDGKTYNDHASSYYELYARTFAFMDSLRKDFPKLLLDCTYETMGRYGLIDYATLKHAHFDWLTNYQEPEPAGPLAIRQMAWDRGRVIPPAACLIGNQPMTGKTPEYTFLSLASSQPIMVGDVRNMTPQLRSEYKRLNDWFRTMRKRYQFTHFYATYDLFDRPTLTNWSGVYRFNAEAGGGVLFFYRNGSLTPTQRFAIKGVIPSEHYCLQSPISGRDYGTFTGEELLNKGVEITLPDTFSAEVIGIERCRQ